MDEYHEHISTVYFTWDAPNDGSRVDYYQYQLIDATSVTYYNTSNTTATISGIPYNNNVTFSILSLNCVGVSSPIIETIHIGRSNHYYFMGHAYINLIACSYIAAAALDLLV